MLNTAASRESGGAASGRPVAPRSTPKGSSTVAARRGQGHRKLVGVHIGQVFRAGSAMPGGGVSHMALIMQSVWCGRPFHALAVVGNLPGASCPVERLLRRRPAGLGDNRASQPLGQLQRCGGP